MEEVKAASRSELTLPLVQQRSKKARRG